MPKITSIEPQKKTLRLRSGQSPRRFNVYLDGLFAFGADEDLIVDRRLVVGKEISTEELEKILFEVEVGKLMERMYRLFNIRLRSEKEIREYLKRLSFKRKVKTAEEISQPAMELLINKLKQKGMVNDEQFTREWVDARKKKKGLRMIVKELYQKGINREIIEEVVSRQVSAGSEEDTAQRLLEKKMKVWKNLPPQEFRKKAYQFLLRRGFEYPMVKEIVEKITLKEV